MGNIAVGKKGEELACTYLMRHGYKILETNRRFSRFCEIDIIAQDKTTTVFCEVKTRRNNICGNPAEAVTKAKYQNIKKGVFFYLHENPNIKRFRIDVISIILEPKLEINHIKNV